MKTKGIGLLGLLAMTMAGLFSPTVASAQTEWGYHRRCIPAPVIIHDRYWREREWRARHRCERERYWGYR